MDTSAMVMPRGRTMRMSPRASTWVAESSSAVPECAVMSRSANECRCMSIASNKTWSIQHSSIQSSMIKHTCAVVSRSANECADRLLRRTYVSNVSTTPSSRYSRNASPSSSLPCIVSKQTMPRYDGFSTQNRLRSRGDGKVAVRRRKQCPFFYCEKKSNIVHCTAQYSFRDAVAKRKLCRIL
jgi:hypothetical protein